MDDIYNAIVIGRAKWAYSFCVHGCEARRCDDSRIAVGIVARRGESRHWEIEGKGVGWGLWRCPLPWWVGGWGIVRGWRGDAMEDHPTTFFFFVLDCSWRERIRIGLLFSLCMVRVRLIGCGLAGESHPMPSTPDRISGQSISILVANMVASSPLETRQAILGTFITFRSMRG